MENKDSNHDGGESSSSDDCVFINESALNSDDELDQNSTIKLDILPTSSLSTAKPLVSHRFSHNEADTSNATHIKNQILDICHSFHSKASAGTKKKLNCVISITKITKVKPKNIFKKIKPKNKQTFHNQSSSSSKTKSEIINNKDASTSKDCELVIKNNLTDNNSINVDKNETKKYLPNTELNINLGTESVTNNFTRQNISSKKNQSKNEYRKDDEAALNGDLNADIKNVLHDDLNDLGCFSDETFEEVVNSENTFDNCVEMRESSYGLSQSDASCSLELLDKTIDNTLANITADYFPTCPESIPGFDTSTNAGANSKDIDTKFLEDIPPIGEMPCVTFTARITKKPKPIDEFVDKIFQLRIEDILKSELIKKDPDIFLFQDVKHKFVRITGTVSYLYRVSASKIFIKINDGTGEICCCFQDFPDRLSNRISIDNHLHKQSERKLFSKKQLLAMGKKNDIIKIEKFLKQNTPGDNPFLNSMNKIMLEKTFKNQPPINKDIHLGGLLTIVGKVIESNERLIYVWRIRKEDKTHLKNQRELDYSQISEYHEHYRETEALNRKEFIYCYI